MFRVDETLLFDVRERSELHPFTILCVALFAIDIFLQFSTILPTLGVQLNTKVPQSSAQRRPEASFWAAKMIQKTTGGIQMHAFWLDPLQCIQFDIKLAAKSAQTTKNGIKTV